MVRCSQHPFQLTSSHLTAEGGLGVSSREGTKAQQTLIEHRRKTVKRHRKKAAICKPRSEASEATNCADILILDLQPPETVRQHVSAV